ncbi:MAG TPA: transporter substrate-binding domain-containing protein [Anaerolineae bacterium]|nr:transporter substrate-binding domain-containing protein [Anaerolineae bacterium]
MSASTKKTLTIVSLSIVAVLLLSACQPSAPADLLGEIKARGTIKVSTDPNYAPQSSSVPDATRKADTKCASDELTSAELEGFDIDTAVEIARRLGVEACFVTPQWEIITAGNWAGRWDISVGSMTITKPRQEVLWFTTGYYFTPAQLAAREGSGIDSVDDIAGKPVCVGTATTYESYLSGEDVGIPSTDIKVPPPAGVQVFPLDTDAECAQAIRAGRPDFDAFLTSGTVVDEAIAQGIPVVKVGSPVFVENLAVSIDKNSPKDPKSLLDEISKIITAMHADGTLKASSMKWFGADLTTAP